MTRLDIPTLHTPRLTLRALAATEIGRAVLDWSWTTLHLSRLISYVRPGNIGSIGVLRKLGAAMVEERDMLGSPAQLWEHRPPPA